MRSIYKFTADMYVVADNEEMAADMVTDLAVEFHHCDLRSGRVDSVKDVSNPDDLDKTVLGGTEAEMEKPFTLRDYLTGKSLCGNCKQDPLILRS